MFRSQSLLANAQTLTPISQAGNKEARELVAPPSTPSGGSPKIKKKKDHRLFFSSLESGPQRKASPAFFRFFELSQTPHPVGVGFVGSSPSEAWGVYLCCRPPGSGSCLSRGTCGFVRSLAHPDCSRWQDVLFWFFLIIAGWSRTALKSIFLLSFKTPRRAPRS